MKGRPSCVYPEPTGPTAGREGGRGIGADVAAGCQARAFSGIGSGPRPRVERVALGTWHIVTCRTRKHSATKADIFRHQLHACPVNWPRPLESFRRHSRQLPMYKTLLLVLSLLTISSQSIAQKAAPPPAKNSVTESVSPVSPAHPACAKLEKVIEVNLKSITAERLNGRNDTSAARATNRLMTEVAAWMENQTYLMQMGSIKCAPVEKPLDPDMYMLPALACAAEEAKLRLSIAAGSQVTTAAQDKFKDACDQAKWTRLDAG